MKTILKLLVISTFFSNYSFSQFYADSTTSNYVIEIMKIADETAKHYDSEKGLQKTFTEEEVERIAELYYKCYNDNPAGIQKYANDKHQEWKKAPLDVVTGKMKLRPWLKVYKLRDQISRKYGIQFTEVIGTPAFLRCRYLRLDFSDYYSTSMNANFKVHNFIFVVEDILKGNKFFSVNDTISILMIPNVESPGPDFIGGVSYLIPVGTLLGHQEGSFNIVFKFLDDAYGVWVMGQPPRTFPIIDEKITNLEYFGINDTSWIDFKKYFKEKYLIFK